MHTSMALLGLPEEILSADSALLACLDRDDMAKHFAALGGCVDPGKYLAAGTLLAWSFDAPGAYRYFEEALARALAQRRYGLAASICAHHSRHAWLLGDVPAAMTAAERGIVLATEHTLSRESVLCCALAADLALARDQAPQARSYLQRARPTYDPELRVMMAPAKALLASCGKAPPPTDSVLEEIAHVAQTSLDPSSLSAATTAWMLIAQEDSAQPPIASAIRRALLLSGAHTVPEMYTLVAAYGRLRDARFAAGALQGCLGAERPYVAAHALLAHAQVLARSGQREQAIDAAASAARGFQCVGIKRWANDAMLVILTCGGATHANGPRRVAPSLTKREEQVAALLRRGASNRDVARALNISEHTVERHVSSILARLGLRSRWQLLESGSNSEPRLLD